jgi:hypothetical protein
MHHIRSCAHTRPEPANVYGVAYSVTCPSRVTVAGCDVCNTHIFPSPPRAMPPSVSSSNATLATCRVFGLKLRIKFGRRFVNHKTPSSAVVATGPHPILKSFCVPFGLKREKVAVWLFPTQNHRILASRFLPHHRGQALFPTCLCGRRCERTRLVRRPGLFSKSTLRIPTSSPTRR